MGEDDFSNWLAGAAEQLDQHEHRNDGARVAGCLASGLSVLHESLYQRIHRDVERAIGKDSMLMPVSEVKARQMAAREIEAYLIAESVLAAAGCGYVDQQGDWFLKWLTGLRLGQLGWEAEVSGRCRVYLAVGPDDRRGKFMDKLGRIVPESRQAPLVLFRLLPLAIQIATACAFGDRTTASRLRGQQMGILPAIADCQECRGKLLECVEPCRACGNPLWKYEWLVAVD